MVIKKISILTIAILFLISSSAFISATVGTLGNARMILYPEVNGWTNTVIPKTILVENQNNFTLNISVKADGNATKFIDVINSSFVLQPGEEEKAQIEIKVKKVGTYQGEVDVYFIPASGKDAGVVLSSTIIVIAKKNQGYTDTNNQTDTSDNSNTDAGSGDNSTNGSTTKLSSNTQKANLSPQTIIWDISTFVLLVFLLILLYIWGKKRSQSKKRKRK